MKKTAAIISLALLLLTPIQSFATQATTGEKFDEAKVLELKKTFNITDEYKNFDFRTDNYRKETRYSYNWNSNNGGISISTDKDDNIIDYFSYDSNDNFSKPSTLKDKTEIEKIATEFLNKIDKNLVNTYKLKDFNLRAKDGRANLTYARYVNDILVLNDGINISVNLKNKTVENFNRPNPKADDLTKFPSAEKAISPEKAKSILTEKNPFILSYRVINYDSDTKVIPVYSQFETRSTIDALTGDFIDKDIYSAFYDYPESSIAEFENYEKALTPVEESEKNGIKNLKDTESAKKEAISKLGLFNAAFENISLSKYNGDDYLYRISYNTENGNSISVNMNAQTLEIFSYNLWNNSNLNRKKEVKLEKSEAIKIANDFLTKMKPSLKNINLENPIVTPSDYDNSTNVEFYTVENSIPVIGNGISINIDNEKKLVTNYHVSTEKVDFPTITKDIGKEKALTTILENFEYEKYYAYIDETPKLIYAFKNNEAPVIRASDGVAINYMGQAKDEKNLVYKDVDKSKYKDEIENLISMNIGVPNVENLKDKIKVKDYIYLLNSTTDSNSIYNIDLTSLTNKYENLKQEDLEKNITNKLAVRWALNSMNYYNLDNFKDVFDKSVFTDSSSIAAEDSAYYFIAHGLSIYDSNHANPNSEITYEEALHIVYNILN